MNLFQFVSYRLRLTPAQRAAYWRKLRHRLSHMPVGLGVYGVASPGVTPLALTVAATVTLTAGAETTIGTFAQLVGTPGENYIPVIMGACSVLMGGTPPSALTFAALFTGGADFATQPCHASALVASTTLMAPIILIGANVRATAAGNIGSTTIAFTGLGTAQNSTVEGPSSILKLFAFPGPDL
jgi:hypothetical protein